MKFVHPIRDQKRLYRLLHFLKDWNPNYYIAAAIGINWGLRCSDILTLTIGDIVTGEGPRIYIANEIRLVEIKNAHERLIPITQEMKQILREHIKWLGYPEIPLETPLVLSRNRDDDGFLKPLSRQRLWEVLTFAGGQLGMRETIGTHSLRKTYVYQAWVRGESLDIIRKELGHDSIEYTERYAAIPLSATRAIYDKVNFSIPVEAKRKRVIHNKSRKKGAK